MNSKAQALLHTSHNWFTANIDRKAFLQGLAGVSLLWIILIIYMMTQTGSVTRELEEDLAVQTILIPRESLRDLPKISALPEMEERDQQESENKIPVVMEGLSPVPIEGLYEETPYGLIPKIRSVDGMTALKAYSRPFNYTEAKPPFIALMIKNYGLSEALATESVHELPPEITFLFNPYSTNIQNIAEYARNNGHETWLQLPVERQNYEAVDTGPKTLMSLNSLNDNLETLDWLMALYPGYAGVASYYDGAFDAAGTMLEKLFKTIYGRGVGYIDLNHDAHGIAQKISIFDDYPYARVNMILSDPKELRLLEREAREKGFAIGVIDISVPKLPLIKNWADYLESKGFTLVPASAITEAPSQLMRIQNPSQALGPGPPVVETIKKNTTSETTHETDEHKE